MSNGVAPGHGADANASANGTGGGGGKEERRKQLAALETKVRLLVLGRCGYIGTAAAAAAAEQRQEKNSTLFSGAHFRTNVQVGVLACFARRILTETPPPSP